MSKTRRIFRETTCICCARKVSRELNRCTKTVNRILELNVEFYVEDLITNSGIEKYLIIISFPVGENIPDELIRNAERCYELKMACIRDNASQWEIETLSPEEFEEIYYG